MMKRTNIRKLSKNNSLPIIRNYVSKRNKEVNFNNISTTTNPSIVKSNANNSTSMSNRSIILLRKIRLNEKFNSQRLINKSEINSSNTNKNTIKLLKNADKIMKERMKFNGLGVPGGKKLLKSVAMRISKEVCYKNYTISLLKERRTNLNLKEYLINKSLQEYSDELEIDNKNFMNFIEEAKNRYRKEEDALIESRQLREKEENLFVKETLLNKKLYETLERKIRELYQLKRYGSFIHKILDKQFIYDDTPEIKARDKNYEFITDFIINMYENKEKYNDLPIELGNIDVFMKKYLQLENNILSKISNKEILEKEIRQKEKYFKYELEQLKLSKAEYESDLKFLENEIKIVKMEMKNYKIQNDENFDNYLHYIVELGKEIGTNVETPKIIDKKYIIDLATFSKKTLVVLGNMEDIINTNILKIENVLNYGLKEDIELMKKFILMRKSFNKREKQLKIIEMQEEIKRLEHLRIYDRAKKLVIKGRNIILDYPIGKYKNKVKKIVKNKNKDNNFEYNYSDTDVEDNEEK